MNRKAAELLLAAVIIARSTSYLFSKIVMEDLGPLNLMTVRFLLAFVFLFVLFFKRVINIDKTSLLNGVILGSIFFAVMCAELFGLKFTDSSTTSFLENTAIVFVPLFEAVLCRKLPKPPAMISATAALVGVGLLTLKSGSFALTFGELLCLLAAVLYAIAIIATDRLSKKGDALLIGIVQVGTMGFLSLAASFIFETPHMPQGSSEWIMIVILAVVCTGFGFTLQPVAQRGTTAETAGLMCALNPLVAGSLGVIFLSEPVSLTGIIGCILILSAIALPYLRPAGQLSQ